jgi:hypothetical protein
VFWDEPLKAILPILAEEAGEEVGLVAGVHDTDYFAKLPGELPSETRFVALPKNDGSTRDFWSAAGEFSALFGSETPVTREALTDAGVSLDRIGKGDAVSLDEATEAWGWRGVASADSVARVTSEVPIHHAFDAIQSTFGWALRKSKECLEKEDKATDDVIEQLQTILCDARDGCPGQTLAECYECMLPRLHRLVTGRVVPAEITRTGKLLRFEPGTAELPRFRFVDLFLRPETALAAKDAYDSAVAHTEVYTLDRFGSGAIPFDLVIPGQGRGTLRLTSKMLIVMTPEPKFIKLDKPVESITDLAEVTDKAFGRCVLVGKAITLIAMLAAEFSFAFYEGASLYVEQTRRLIADLEKSGVVIAANPIVRISLNALDSLRGANKWFRLPEPLRAPFGADVISSATMACSWRCVSEQQSNHLSALAQARNVSALLDCLQTIRGGRWERLREEYESLRASLAPLDAKISALDEQVSEAHRKLREIKRARPLAEAERGAAFRNGDQLKREHLGDRIAAMHSESRKLHEELVDLRNRKAERASAAEVRAARERRLEIEREAELARLRTVREAITSGIGLEKINRRPSAWWFPLVTPDGSWFEGLRANVELRLEPLH